MASTWEMNAIFEHGSPLGQESIKANLDESSLSIPMLFWFFSGWQKKEKGIDESYFFSLLSFPELSNLLQHSQRGISRRIFRTGILLLRPEKGCGNTRSFQQQQQQH